MRFQRRDIAGAAAALGIAALVHVLLGVQPDLSSPQADANLRFASEGSLPDALADYPPRWPPLYPSVLWLLARADVSAVWANQLLFYGVLLAMAVLARRTIPGVHPAYPVLLVAALESSYPMIRLATSELLFSLLGLCTLGLAARSRRSASSAARTGLAAVGAALCLTRYFGVVWTGPLLVWHSWRGAGGSIAQRARRTLVFSGLLLAPVAAWIVYARVSTGFWTGTDRLKPRRGFRADAAGVEDLLIDVTHLVKTPLVDFFSVQNWGRHAVINHDYELVAGEVAIAVLACALSAAVAVGLFRALGRGRPRAAPSAETGLLLQLVVLYPVAILFLWSTGNPDRIYTRFLYPWYPPLILLGTALYGWTRRNAPSFLLLWPFRGLYGLMLAAQCARHVPHLWAAFG
ncbi:MAG: hypothetical protein O7G30_14035 [Proteobacteria bacterium]|nr:hypothetical protein [Pseudomonadota bacterium]